ncbi:hypothetical protein ACJX0J_034192, partial [Zea mays]
MTKNPKITRQDLTIGISTIIIKPYSFMSFAKGYVAELFFLCVWSFLRKTTEKICFNHDKFITFTNKGTIILIVISGGGTTNSLIYLPYPGPSRTNKIMDFF